MRPKGSGRNGQIRYLDENERLRFMKEAQKDKMADLAFSLTLSFGLRVGELATIRLSDINFDAKEIFVKAMKSGREKHHPLSDKLVKKIKSWLRARKKLRTAEGNDYLFPGRFVASHYSRDGFQLIFKRLCDKVGIKNHSIHDLRHTSAIMLVEQGEHVVDIRDRLRHRSLQSTEVYLQIVNNRKAEIRQNQMFDKIF